MMMWFGCFIKFVASILYSCGQEYCLADQAVRLAAFERGCQGDR